MTSRYGLEIRSAMPIDAPGLALLLKDAGMSVDTHELAERLTAIKDAAGTTLVAVQWGPPTGVVVFHWYAAINESRPVALITTLLVAVDDRRRGIGRLLLKAAAQAARAAGCGRLELVVPADSASLQEFCRATGFAEAGLCFARSLRKGA